MAEDQKTGMKKLRWTSKARRELKEILEFWTDHNASDTYSLKLLYLFNETALQIASTPGLGKQSDIPFVRMKLVRDYWLFYSESQTEIEILQIKSTHQDPESFYKHL